MQFSAGELASPLVVEAALVVGRSAAQAEWDRHMAGIALMAVDFPRSQNARTSL